MVLRAVLLGILVAAACAGGPAAGIPFWDADFDEQPLGPLPVGLDPEGPPELPTFVRSTFPSTYEVVSASGDLLQQPVEVRDAAGSVPRVAFRLEQAAAFDALTEGLVRIELDMLAGACTTDFGGNACYGLAILREGGGNVGGIEWGLDGVLRLTHDAEFVPIPYVVDAMQHIAVELDLDAVERRVVFRVDGARLGSVGFPADALFDGIALQGGVGAVGRFAFDNVRIEAVPEPGAQLLVAAAVVAFLAYCVARGRRSGRAASRQAADESRPTRSEPEASEGR
ncbi:MAG: hypothetical protein JSU66_07545, partial [Deltaproteobacteria bacterium]